ncbi:serine/threonine protein kinase [Actinoplanes sp. NPDC051851]|uniref:serine/threonine protein kinase n=1 Tax=Actinoplanes sp. NPDC051851 TaxID=3154753 RepID=UPI0034211986
MSEQGGSRSGPLQAGDPDRVGEYEVLGRLGAGGMGVVYLARGRDGRLVAVKVVYPALAHDEEFRRRFRSEVARARQVPPFCTAEVLDADPDAPQPYLVVEYVDGPTLGAEVREKGPLTAANLHAVAVGIATALTVIHEAGVIHRDLKPGNVLLAPGSPKVIDFGIARAMTAAGTQHTRTGQFMGTVGYMAPERFDEPATPLTPAADVFAWGCVVAFAGTGRPPFTADSPMATLAKMLTQPPVLDGLADGPLRALVERSLAKDPAARPTARELLDQLLATSPQLPSISLPPAPASPQPASPQPASPQPASPQPASLAPRRERAVPVLAGTVAVLALALMGGAGFTVYRNTGQNEQVTAGASPENPVPAVAGPTSPAAVMASSPQPSIVTPPATRSPAPKPSSKSPKPKVTTSAPDGQPPVAAADVTAASYGPFFLRNYETGYCADLDGTGAGKNKQPVVHDVCIKDAADNQEFVFVPTGEDASGNQLYLIRDTTAGRCLDAEGTGAVEAGVDVVVLNCDPLDNQEFRLQPQLTAGGFRYYRLIHTDEGLCLDVFGNGPGRPAAPITLTDCLANDDHEWALVTRADL